MKTNHLILKKLISCDRRHTIIIFEDFLRFPERLGEVFISNYTVRTMLRDVENH